MAKPVFLVTGAHGCIGAWVAKYLIESDQDVVLFDQDPRQTRLELIINKDALSSATVATGNVCDRAALPTVIAKYNVDRIIHLAALQIPGCRAEPAQGAIVNVLGTVNVFEAVSKVLGQVKSVVYASSAAVFGNSSDDHVKESDAAVPVTLYGAYKRCNEDIARIYFQDKGIQSIGLRAHSIFGVGRDVGITSDLTKAMKAVVLNRPFRIRFTGNVDFQYVADTAEALVRCAMTDLDGAHVFNLHGETLSVHAIATQIEKSARQILGNSVSPQITASGDPFSAPARIDDTALQRALGGFRVTPTEAGVGATISRFAELARRGSLDASDLEL